MFSALIDLLVARLNYISICKSLHSKASMVHSLNFFLIIKLFKKKKASLVHKKVPHLFWKLRNLMP
jgi:hypothetical protein